MPVRHASSSPPENTICKTGQSARNGSSPPDAATENPVAFRITAGGCAAKMLVSNEAASAAFRLCTKMGNGHSRRAISACTSASNAA